MATPPYLEPPLEKSTMRKVTLRLMPLILICFIIAYIDRSNISIAALTMDQQIGMTAAQYGLGASLFFTTYVVLEIPSNIVLARVGSRRWIARIMITWGIIAGLMAFISAPWHFYALRILIGAAEAGFTPGIMYYLSTWYPNRHRARAMSRFYIGAALATVIGAPIGGLLVNSLDGFLGRDGWQWLFIIEAIPAIVMAFVVWKFLTDTPEQATWLPEENKKWLITTLAAERAAAERLKKFTILGALTNPGVWSLAVFLFLFSVNSLGLTLWMPQVVAGTFGQNPLASSLLTGVPYLLAVVGMVIVARITDHRGRMHLFMGYPMIASALLMVASLYAGASVLGFILLSLSTATAWSTLPAMWKSATAFMTGVAAAAGIAFINAFSNLAGLTMTPLIGALKDATGSFDIPLLIIAAAMALGAIVAFTTKRFTQPGLLQQEIVSEQITEQKEPEAPHVSA